MRILNSPGSLGKSSLALSLLLAACAAAAPPRLILSERSEGANVLLAAHPADPGRNITPYALAHSERTSAHLIWVRDREQPHLHATHDLVVTVLRGEGTLWLRGRELPMRAGDIAAVPAGVPHFFVNTGDEPAAAFVVFAPPSDGSDNVPTE